MADPGDPEAVWAGTTGILARGGVYRSLDAGERWSFRSEGLTFRRSDRGDTWTHLWRFQSQGTHGLAAFEP